MHNLKKQETIKFKMKTIAYPEGIPRHHFQIAIKSELQGVPTFRKVVLFTAYDEGWGLYSEHLDEIMTSVTERKTREDFIEFMEA
ncbi:MAG: DUF885 family protein [Cyclobacterium sp.]|nr:DUF885 family protein [Cyclobacterium sp.]